MRQSRQGLRAFAALCIGAALLALSFMPWSSHSADAASPERERLTLPSEQGANDWRVSHMGPDGDIAYSALGPAVAYDRIDDQYLAVWTGDDAVADAHDVYGQRIDAAGGTALGGRFTISLSYGGDNLYNARDVALTYDDDRNQYLVVWAGSSASAGMGAGEIEIWGQRVAGTDGALLGDAVRISSMGADGDTSRAAFDPDVAYNGVDGEFFVVWHGDDVADNVVEVYGQRLDAAGGALVGATGFVVSQMGTNPADAAFRGQHAAVAYDNINNNYLVVWEGDSDVAPLIDEAFEIFGQRLWPDGTPLGTPGFRISAMGSDDDPDYDARRPALAFHSLAQEYLVVWAGEDDRDDGAGPLADEEYEIYGQRLDAGGNAVGKDDFRISAMGPDGNPVYKAFHPRVAFVPNDAYLVVWRGDDGPPSADDAFEVYAQMLEGDGTATGPDDWRLSDMGNTDGSAAFGADHPALAIRGCRGNAMVLWQGDDETGTLVQDEIEVFGQALGSGYAGAVLPEIVAAGSPERFCPGWNLYYTLEIDNTTACVLTDVLVSVSLPPASCCLQDGAGSDVPGQLQPGETTMVWSIPFLSPGEQRHIEVSLHPHSSLADGTVVTTTFSVAANELLGPETREVGATADRSLCAQPTPTATVTQMATPTPTMTADPNATPTAMATAMVDPDVTPTATPEGTPMGEAVGRICLPMVIH